MIIKQALIFGTEKFKKNKINSALLDAEILLSCALGKPKEFIYAHPEYQISKTQDAKYKKHLLRRLKGEPTAYILGHKEFYGLNFLVNNNVLIPRPETELLVEEVLKYIKNSKLKIKNSTLADIGTGSGCIPIAIAKNLYNVECIKYYGIDNSIKALVVARKNAKLHGVVKKIKFIKSDLLKNISHNTLYFIHNTCLVLTANLPYLPAKIYRQNYQHLKYEPKNSLLAGQDGLKYYRQLFKQLQPMVNCQWSIVSCFLEIDPSQTIALKKLIKKYLPAANITVKKDLAGLNRLAIVKLSQNHKSHSNSF